MFSAVAIIFWVLVIWGGFMLVNRYAHRQHQALGKSNQPLEIAKIRYANGDITKDEYETLRKDLAK